MEVAAWFGLFFLLPPPSDPNQIKEPLSSTISKKQIFGVERAIDIPDSVFPSKTNLDELERGMEDCEHLWFDSTFESAKLHYRKWVPKGGKKPKGVIIWLHGISAHSGRSLVLDGGRRKVGTALQAECWLKEGYALYAMDHYGHGYSEGLRWFVPSYEVNRDDIINFIKLVASEYGDAIPIIVTAESYGGCLALHVAKQIQQDPKGLLKGFDSMILHAPAIIPPDLPPKPVVAALTKLASYYPTWIPFFMPNPVSTDRVWRDKEVLAIIDTEERREMRIEGGGKPFRLATAVGMLDAMEKVREEVIPGLTTPFLVIHGEKDTAVPVSGTEFLLEEADTTKENRAVLRHPEAYHDLMCDPTVDKTMECMIDFANKRVAAFHKT